MCTVPKSMRHVCIQQKQLANTHTHNTFASVSRIQKLSRQQTQPSNDIMFGMNVRFYALIFMLHAQNAARHPYRFYSIHTLTNARKPMVVFLRLCVCLFWRFATGFCAQRFLLLLLLPCSLYGSRIARTQLCMHICERNGLYNTLIGWHATRLTWR